jgi:hypothetical protein
VNTKCISATEKHSQNFKYLQLIATERLLQISPAKTNYLEPSYFTDIDKHITTIDRPEIFVISSYILYFRQSCGFILITSLGKLVIFMISKVYIILVFAPD